MNQPLALLKLKAGDGTVWYVREAMARDIPGAEADSCLIFDSGYSCHRIWHYPEGWMSLPVSSLLTLLNNRRPLRHEPSQGIEV
jgi:hypothetical protein